MSKPLPQDKELEESLLGAMLIDDTIIEPFMLMGEIEWFYDDNVRTIIKIIYELKLEGSETDMVTIKNKLEEKGKLAKVGGVLYLSEIIEATPTSSHWKSYATKLQDIYKRREIIREGDKLKRLGYGQEDLDKGVENAFNSINKVLMEGEAKSTSAEDNIVLLEKHLAEYKGKDLLGWSWGNSWLDSLTKGIRKAKTYRIGSPSGVGKTNLIYQTIVSLLEQGAKVQFNSLENSIETTYIKLLSSVQGCNPNDIETGRIAPDLEWIKRYKDSFILTDQLFEFADIKRETIKNKPDVVVLDYIGLVNMKGYDEKSLYNKYADEVKQFVQQHQWLSWIDLSNLNKDDNEEKIREYKGFNGSAKLRNNTDVAIHMFYHKPFYEWKTNVVEAVGIPEAQEKYKGHQVITFLCSKNRLGVQGVEETFKINFNQGIRYKQATAEDKEKWKVLVL